MKKLDLKFRRIFVMLGLLMATMVLSSSCSCSMNSGSIGGELSYKDSELAVKPFSKIEVETIADVFYTQNDGDKQSVQFDFSKIKDADLQKKFKENMVAIYREGKVIIGLKHKIMGITNLKQGERVRVMITSPDLVKVTLEGVGTFQTDAINSDVFGVDNEGVGNITIEKMLVNNLTVDNEGVGNVKIGELQADQVSIDNEGVGNVTIDQFKGGKMDIDNDGVGNVKVQVDCQTIKATLEGVGGIKLSGVTRRLTQVRDGVGKINISELKVLDK